MIRFATIGYNFITKLFLEAARNCGELKYMAAYSRKEDKAKGFTAKYGAEKYYSNPAQMAGDKDIDAVYIASPNSCHCEQAILMMENGKHMLCEKPSLKITPFLKQCHLIIKTLGNFFLKKFPKPL